LRVVIISPYQFRLRRGVERYVHALANQLAAQSVQVIVYSWSSKGIDWGAWDRRIRIRRKPRFPYYESYFAALYYRIWLIRDRPDMVLINFLYHGEQYLPPIHRYLYVLHSPASLITGRYEFIRSKLRRFPNLRFVAVSQMVEREARPYVEARDIEVIPLGVDTELFLPSESSARSDRIMIVSVAALERRKGLQLAVEAISSWAVLSGNDVEYHIYGDGPYRAALEEKIHDQNADGMVFLHPSNEQIHLVLPRYDLLVLLSRGEAFGLVVLEAMACGVPVLVSRQTPFTEFVDRSVGRLVEADDVDAIAKGIEEILANRQTLSVNARKASLRYEWRNVAGQYAELARDWINSSTNGCSSDTR